MITNYYNILNIKSSADINTIKIAFRKEIAIYHPDNNKTKEAKVKFDTVVEAFDVLSNIEKRKAYNKILMSQTENLPILVEQKENYECWLTEAKTKSKSFKESSLNDIFLLDIFTEIGVNGLILGTESMIEVTEPLIDGLSDTIGDVVGDVIGGIFDAL